MEQTIEQTLHQGVSAHKEGKLRDAECLYKAILQSQPSHPEANHNLGLIAVAFDKAEVALPLFRNALKANPRIEQFWISHIDALVKVDRLKDAKQAIKKARKKGFDAKKLSTLLSRSKGINVTKVPSQQQLDILLRYFHIGRFSDAERLCIKLTREFPKHQFAWKVLGAVLMATGRNSEALGANRRAIALSPKDAHAHSNLGVAFQELGRLDEAEIFYKKAIALTHDYADAHYNLGNMLQERSRFNEAEASYSQAIALNPNYTEAHYNLANMLGRLGRLEEATSSYHKAIALKPNYVDAHTNLGNTLRELGRLEEAETSYKQAIFLKPDYAEGYNNLSNMLQELGRFDEAKVLLTKALALKPDFAEVHRHLARMKKFNTQDEQFSKMRDLYRNKNISQEERCHISFGLAKACEDLGNFDKAYLYYSEGNALRKKLLNYDINRDIKLFRQIQSNYPRIERYSLQSDKLSKSLTPIFIVGMPRSGTTLVEQIVSSHSKVTGAGELNFATQHGGSIAIGITEANHESLLNFRSAYLTKLDSVSNKNLIITDKMPSNFRYLGLLAASFPEAKIIHVKRNPAAVCWANYKQYFDSKNLNYCYSLGDIISYHSLYGNLMRFWAEKLDNRIYNLDYEQLTVNQEIETRRLIEHLDLDWDDNCLSPQNNKRGVSTASNLQIRQNVYRGSSEQWKKYQPFLNGALDGLPPL